jgi:hypothetical protein
MDEGRWPGRRDDGLVVPTVMAALLGGLGVLAVALAGSRGFTEALPASGSTTSPATVTPAAGASAGASADPPPVATVAPPVATVAPATALPTSGSVPPVEASTAPPPIQVTP